MLSPPSDGSHQSKPQDHDEDDGNKIHEPGQILRDTQALYSRARKQSENTPERLLGKTKPHQYPISPPFGYEMGRTVAREMAERSHCIPYQSQTPPLTPSGASGEQHPHAHSVHSHYSQPSPFGLRRDALNPSPYYAQQVSLSESALRDRYFSEQAYAQHYHHPRGVSSSTVSLLPPLERSAEARAHSQGYRPHSYPSSLLSPDRLEDFRGRRSLPPQSTSSSNHPRSHPQARLPKDVKETKGCPPGPADYARFYEYYSNTMPSPSSNLAHFYSGKNLSDDLNRSLHYSQSSGHQSGQSQDQFSHSSARGRRGAQYQTSVPVSSTWQIQGPPPTGNRRGSHDLTQEEKTTSKSLNPRDGSINPAGNTQSGTNVKSSIPNRSGPTSLTRPTNQLAEEQTPSPSTSSFQRGSLIELYNGQVKRVEELRTSDFLHNSRMYEDIKLEISRVVSYEIGNAEGQQNSIHLAVSANETRVSLEASSDHPFFVPNHGWSSVDPVSTLEKYNLPCRRLRFGDECLTLSLNQDLIHSEPEVLPQEANTTPGETPSEAEMMPPPPPPRTTTSQHSGMETTAPDECSDMSKNPGTSIASSCSTQDGPHEQTALETKESLDKFKRPPDKTQDFGSPPKRRK
ncbi:hypothetical protein TCAL_04178 [Tigriopus californicus]|uniref:AXH domain-containing protein n=1 Tax=Tigriopus californicus TaxID=6832 RepID=A0A553N7W7_TIGCA|nr:uncharacterized protein LOC131885934 [Tigriopus californicus]TRY61535.1 hypothetical protein TCAL_04178 [Tigriopus californicus]|eukprot:TCALIF_04178-PA protein Name:"Similar to Atxn1l Ataxin-1-like (Mus musculus)" AED:0.00 eAED:0.00 QI:604/1/1/1/0.5/0.66/3/149/627